MVGGWHRGVASAVDERAGRLPFDAIAQAGGRPYAAAEGEAVDDLEVRDVQDRPAAVSADAQVVVDRQRPEQAGGEDPAVVIMDYGLKEGSMEPKPQRASTLSRRRFVQTAAVAAAV